MAIKLHRCSATFVKGPHPCWAAQHALDEAGIEYELVKHSPLRLLRRRPQEADRPAEAARWSSSRTAPSCADSKVIAQQAQAGALHGPGESVPLS